MKISKSLDIDLNIISPQKHIRIHEGDVDSVDILIGVSVDDDSVDLDGVTTIKYDATINNYLAEQDADGSVVDGKISIPVTQNMTAMSGLLLIDVRMIRNDQILHTQTICATVEKAVVNGSTYIDFDKVTIIQRMNALEKQMEHVEEIIKDFDTSKLIVSTNLPPMSVPSEVDVDLLRVGDTWIQRGANIVYKLTEAQYNYQDDPSVEPYHKFTWQPLNKRYVSGDAEPPTTATYDRVSYDIETWHFSGLPVPEYFKGDQYSQMVDSDPEKHFTLNSAQISLISFHTVVYHYDWREEGGSGDLSAKMDLAPINPTAEEIAALPAGQLYGDMSNHKGILKTNGQYPYQNGQEFYDSVYIDQHYKQIYDQTGTSAVPILVQIGTSKIVEIGSTLLTRNGAYILFSTGFNPNRILDLTWRKTATNNIPVLSVLPTGGRITSLVDGIATIDFYTGDLVEVSGKIYECSVNFPDGTIMPFNYEYEWREVDYYTKTEINNMIGDIGTALDTLNNNLAEV